MSAKQQAEELAMRAAMVLRNRDLDSADARDAEIILRECGLEELIAERDKLRAELAAAEKCVRALRRHQRGIDSSLVDGALSAYDATKGAK